MMEVVTQWTARRTYQQLLEPFKRETEHQADIIKNGLSYSVAVKRFDSLLNALSVKDEILLPRLQSLISKHPTSSYLEMIKDELADLSGAEKSAIRRALSKLSASPQDDYENFLRILGLIH